MKAHEYVILEIARERERQVVDEGWTPQHDDEHDPGELATAACAYVLNAACLLSPLNGTPIEFSGDLPVDWPWDESWWKPTLNGDGRRDLIKAAALIVAELERMDRQTDSGPSDEIVRDPGGDPYQAVVTRRACGHCGRGDTWGVIGPDDVLQGVEWVGDDSHDAQVEAEELAGALSAAFELGTVADEVADVE